MFIPQTSEEFDMANNVVVKRIVKMCGFSVKLMLTLAKAFLPFGTEQAVAKFLGYCLVIAK